MVVGVEVRGEDVVVWEGVGEVFEIVGGGVVERGVLVYGVDVVVGWGEVDGDWG